MLTGCRKSEILSLRWEYVDLEAGELRLPDSKTGAKIVHLGDPAISVLQGIERNEDNPWVHPNRKTGKPMSDLDYYWQRIRDRAGLKGVRVHDLRHSFASRALSLGESLPMIGKLLGHTKVETTARYAHLARDSVKIAGERVAVSLSADAKLPRGTFASG